MRTVAVATAGTLVLAGGVILGQQTRQPSSQPIFTPGPAEIVGSVSITNAPTVQSQQSGMWEVRLTDPVALVIPTPEFSVVGQSYTFTWPGSDTAQTYRVLSLAGNGWVRADPAAGGAGRWLNTSLATSIEPQQVLPPERKRRQNATCAFEGQFCAGGWSPLVWPSRMAPDLRRAFHAAMPLTVGS